MNPLLPSGGPAPPSLHPRRWAFPARRASPGGLSSGLPPEEEVARSRGGSFGCDWRYLFTSYLDLSLIPPWERGSTCRGPPARTWERQPELRRRRRGRASRSTASTPRGRGRGLGPSGAAAGGGPERFGRIGIRAGASHAFFCCWDPPHRERRRRDRSPSRPRPRDAWTPNGPWRSRFSSPRVCAASSRRLRPEALGCSGRTPRGRPPAAPLGAFATETFAPSRFFTAPTLRA